MSALTGLDAVAAGIEERLVLEGVERIEMKDLIVLLLVTVRHRSNGPRYKLRDIIAAGLAILTALGVVSATAATAAANVFNGNPIP